MLTFEPENAIITASLLGSSIPLNEKRGDNMATSSITANFYCDDAKAANAFVRMLAQPVRTVVRKKRSQTVVNDTTVDDEDAFVKRFKARWSRSRRVRA